MSRTMRDPKPKPKEDPPPIVVPEDEAGDQQDNEAAETDKLAVQLLKRMEKELDELEAVLRQSDSVIGDLRKRREVLRIRIEALEFEEFDPRDEEEDEVDWSELKKKGSKIKDDWDEEENWGEEDDADNTDSIIRILRDYLPSNQKTLTIEDCWELVNSNSSDDDLEYTMKEVHYALKVGYHQGYFGKDLSRQGTSWFLNSSVQKPKKKKKKS